jgi:hypothetical protein
MPGKTFFLDQRAAAADPLDVGELPLLPIWSGHRMVAFFVPCCLAGLASCVV